MTAPYGVHGLLSATLLMAIADARKGYPDAAEWIDDDQDGTFTFKWTCDHLALDCRAVRQAVRNRGAGCSPS